MVTENCGPEADRDLSDALNLVPIAVSWAGTLNVCQSREVNVLIEEQVFHEEAGPEHRLQKMILNGYV